VVVEEDGTLLLTLDDDDETWRAEVVLVVLELITEEVVEL